MQRIEIRNFGPIEHVDLDVKDFMVFIGPQASGKSTIAKVIYFFQSLREDFVEAIMENLTTKKEIRAKDLFGFRLISKFRLFWGENFDSENSILRCNYSSNFNFLQRILMIYLILF
jgi:predicted ATPase